MITTSKKPGHQYLRKLLVLPVTAIITALFAFSYQVKEAEGLNEDSQHVINRNLLSPYSAKPPGILLNGHISLSKVDAASPNSASKIIFNGKQLTINQLTLDGMETLKIDSAEIYVDPRSGNEIDSAGKPLVLLDGKKQTWNSISEILKYLDPAVIQTITILKGSSALIKYGEDAKYGAIEINTRKSDNNEIIDIKVDKQITADTEIKVDKQEPVEIEIKVDKHMTSETEIKVDKQITSETEIKVDKQKPVEIEIKVDKQMPTKFIDVKVDKQKPAKTIDKKVDKQKPQEIIYKVDIKKLNADNSLIFEKAEIEPAFPGGESSWRQYLEKNKDGGIPAEKGAPAGNYTVIVHFIVRTDGSLGEVKALTKFGYGMEEEAIRLIKQGPQWIPAIQNGKKVNSYMKQPISFLISKNIP